ncbi:hypothetical protein ACFP9V_02375 [Deinococcus radiopugnans]|uniref:Uncharacterized protein n=1 Tax=Deinococcus radiopugnans ATCC 19172 TaxID=585398 RepID=A0A5C4Y850_9DEIO|nr:hypothetical protein [Deinococcus radiopugnans]MBB6014937.1 hypothetical protein [Deinococcus radiopugnans ATCC 19172]TNM71650.1 hypothetical protein FHR04_06775 [Deinococcus radiopugnans ATCC 19172]
MTPEEHCVAEALDKLREKFELSELAQSDVLLSKSLILVECETSWTGSFSEGQIYASSGIELKNAEDKVFCWTLNFIYEREPNRLGNFLHWGSAYSSVHIFSADDLMATYKDVYGIGEADLITQSNKTIQLADLADFSKGIVALSGICFQDLEYIYQNNLFPRIAALALEIEKPLASNPFKE